MFGTGSNAASLFKRAVQARRRLAKELRDEVNDEVGAANPDWKAVLEKLETWGRVAQADYSEVFKEAYTMKFVIEGGGAYSINATLNFSISLPTACASGCLKL